jgi:hypothetical protein
VLLLDLPSTRQKTGPSSIAKEVYNPKAVIPHAALLRQASAHCARFPTAASRRSLGRVSVPVWPITLSGRLSVVALVGHHPTNKLIDRGPIPHRKTFHHQTCIQRSYPVLDPVSQAYPEVEGRSPTCYSPVRRSCTPKGLTARLACVKHAASVRPEPGSNSPTKNIGTNSPRKKPDPHWHERPSHSKKPHDTTTHKLRCRRGQTHQTFSTLLSSQRTTTRAWPRPFPVEFFAVMTTVPDSIRGPFQGGPCRSVPVSGGAISSTPEGLGAIAVLRLYPRPPAPVGSRPAAVPRPFPGCFNTVRDVRGYPGPRGQGRRSPRSEPVSEPVSDPVTAPASEPVSSAAGDGRPEVASERSMAL